MQFLEGQNWLTNFRTFYASGGNESRNDINNDGLKDFQQIMKNGTYVFLFDREIKRFTDTPINIALKSELLNSKKNIHCQLWQQNDPEWTSDLYRFSGLKQKFLYTLKCKPSDRLMHSAGSMLLYKCANGNLEDTLFIKEIKIDKDYYDLTMKNIG